MAEEQSPRSLKLIAVLLVGACLAVFTAIIFFIFNNSMANMLERAEDKYLEKQLDAVAGSFAAAKRNAYLMAEDMGNWNAAVLFVKGQNPGFIQDNWPDNSMLQSYRFNLVVIKDLHNADRYVAFHDYLRDKDLPTPQGFTRSLDRLAIEALEQARQPQAPVSDAERYTGGILFFENVPYFVAAAPILSQRESGDPAGTVFFGIRLDNEYFRHLTHYNTVTFTLVKAEGGVDSGNKRGSRKAPETVSATLPLRDIDGDSVLLHMGDNRTIFLEGQSILNRATVLLFFVQLLLAMALYQIFMRVILRPVEQLSRDMKHVASLGDIEGKNYSTSREFEALCSSINDMVRRLNESKVSMDVLLNILNGLDAYLFVCDPHTDEILFINDKMAEHYGIKGNAVGQICWKVLQTGFTEHCDFCPNRRLLTEPESVIIWEEHSTRTGRHYRNMDCLIEWADKRLVRLQHSVDITDFKSMEEKLVRMSSIVDSAPQYIAYISKDGAYEYVNRGAQDLLGYSEEELMAGGLAMIFDSQTYDQSMREILPCALREEKSEFEVPVIRKDGQTRIMAASAFKTAFKNLGFGIIASDITDKRNLERELIAAKEQAEQSNQAKSEFLSRMSHEIRTPMNAIIGMTSIARSSKDPVQKEYCLDKVSEASAHLLGVINDILDMAKIEANKFELSYAEFDLERMLMRAINVINFRVDEKDQNLIVNLDPTIPRIVISDEQRLAQIIANLLSNAVKFTPERGTVTLSVNKINEENGFCTLQFSVVDTGIGISQEQQAKLFRSFEQADGSISRKFGGTGLGLAISKSIVELMGGVIWVESEDGRGANFSFTIRAQRGNDSRQALLGPEVNWKNLRILAVDDAPEVREYFLNFAQSVGVACEVAANGFEACRLLENRGQVFNIAFVDWKMPGMNGVELALKIKENFGKKSVVIMISATSWNDIEDSAKAVGVDRFVPKPLFASALVDCINECMGLAASRERAEADADQIRSGCFADHRVLLVEDIDINREIVVTLLEHTGLHIDHAENGLRAYEMFRDNPDRYSMIFMDIHMPEMDGYEATKRIRALDTPQARSIPIVAMTANVFREDIERCLSAGMDDHVGKPIDLQALLSKLEKCLKITSRP